MFGVSIVCTCRTSGRHVIRAGHSQHGVGSTTGNADDHVHDCDRHGYRAGRCLEFPAQLAEHTVSCARNCPKNIYKYLKYEFIIIL